LRRRTTKILERHGLGDRLDIVQELVDEVSWAFAASEHKLTRNGRGGPIDGPEKLLAVLVPEILKGHGMRGNRLQGDDGAIGMVAELEAVAEATLRRARTEDAKTISRPARTSGAQETRGSDPHRPVAEIPE
jgi:hypothetical protein